MSSKSNIEMCMCTHWKLETEGPHHQKPTQADKTSSCVTHEFSTIHWTYTDYKTTCQRDTTQSSERKLARVIYNYQPGHNTMFNLRLWLWP